MFGKRKDAVEKMTEKAKKARTRYRKRQVHKLPDTATAIIVVAVVV
jgi:hypothetical protein